MKKIILIISIFFLVIVTTLTKNSSKNLEKEIYITKENINILENKYELVLLEYNFLTSPKKLLEYQNTYFEDDLESLNINFFNEIEIDNNRLMQELAYLLERSDITEEIVRADIHLEAFIYYLKYDEPVGKRLSFLIQELNREVNTIGSKSPMHEVTGMIVEVKNEIEKIREQVQNIL